MPDIKCIVVQPDVCFDGDGADREGAVEREGAPVVVVAMNGDGEYILSQARWIGVEGCCVGIAQNSLKRR